MGKKETREDRERLQNLAEHVRRLMETANLSLRAVSKGTNIPHTTLSRLLRQENVPTLGHVCRLAEFFGRSVEELTGDGRLKEVRSQQLGVRRDHPHAETLTSKRKDGYNPGNMSTSLLAPNAASIGRKIAEKRQTKGFSQAQLAAEAGVDRVSISRMERGHQGIAFRTLGRIASALGTTAADLMAGF